MTIQNSEDVLSFEQLQELVTSALEEGLLINVTRDNVVRLLPPLTLSDQEADELVTRVARVINNA